MQPVLLWWAPSRYSQMEEDLASGLQLGPNSTFGGGPGSRSRSSLAGRKSSGVYRPPRPSSLPNSEHSLSGRASLPSAASRASLGSLGTAQYPSGSQNYHSRFQKVGEAPGAATSAAKLHQPDRHPYAASAVPIQPECLQELATTEHTCCRRVTPATSPEEGADRAGDAVLDLTDAEQRQAKRDELRGEHEKTQMQLMKLLDQIREVRRAGLRRNRPAV